MVIVFLPALEGLRPQWREAALNLGQYFPEADTQTEFGMIAGHHMGLVVAAGQDHRESGRQLSQRNQCLPAVHARHGQIAEYAADFIPVLPEYLHSLDAVLCQEHHKPEAHERAFAYLTHHRFVVNQQDFMNQFIHRLLNKKSC